MAPWRGGEYVYLEYGEHRYWSMGAPPEITTILNRAQLEAVGLSESDT